MYLLAFWLDLFSNVNELVMIIVCCVHWCAHGIVNVRRSEDSILELLFSLALCMGSRITLRPSGLCREHFLLSHPIGLPFSPG